jgi:hypothetical protein
MWRGTLQQLKRRFKRRDGKLIDVVHDKDYGYSVWLDAPGTNRRFPSTMVRNECDLLEATCLVHELLKE